MEFATPLPQRGKLVVELPAVPGHRSDARRSLARRLGHELRSAKLAPVKAKLAPVKGLAAPALVRSTALRYSAK